MKKCIFFILGCIPIFLCAQRVVILPVNQLPVLSYEASAESRALTIIAGNSVTLGSDLKIWGGSGIYFYKWSPGKTLNDSTTINPVAKPDKNTTYILTITDLKGCSIGIE